MLVDGVIGLINPALEKLIKKLNAQTVKQGEALLKLLESKTSILDAFPAEFPSTPITPEIIPSVPFMIAPVTPVAPTSSDTLPPQPATPSLDSNKCPQYLKDFFQDKKPLTNFPVSQFEIDFLMTHFPKENDAVVINGLWKACAKVHLSIPKSLSKKMSSPQTKSFIYKLAMAIHTKSNESKRYLYRPVFSYKSENIVTAFVDSKHWFLNAP